MPNTFNDANKATEELFENDMQSTMGDAGEQEENPAEIVEAENLQAEEAPQAKENPPAQLQEQAMLNDAVQTAETAAQAASEKDAQLQQILQELEAAKQQTTQMQATIEELSRQNKKHIVEEVLEPPVLDVSALAFADEETVKAAQAKYAQDMADYNRQAFMKEFAPVIEQANEAKYNKEKNEVISALSQIPELSGIDTMLPQLDKIIRNNKALSSDDVPLDEKFITAYAIARGVNSINTPPEEPKELTAEDMLKMYNENPAFQEMVEKQRIAQVENSQQVPPFSASSGAVNAALNIKEKPKTFDEASERTRKMFGLG